MDSCQVLIEALETIKKCGSWITKHEFEIWEISVYLLFFIFFVFELNRIRICPSEDGSMVGSLNNKLRRSMQAAVVRKWKRELHNNHNRSFNSSNNNEDNDNDSKVKIPLIEQLGRMGCISVSVVVHNSRYFWECSPLYFIFKWI